MAKRIVASLAASVLLVTMGPVAPPASAANAVVTVPGHAGLARAGLWYVAQRCDNPAANPTSQFVETPAKDGGARGTHALGWKFPTPGNEVGTLGYTSSPRTLTRFDSYIKGVNSPGLTGHAVAIYDDTAGSFASGRWVGRSNQFSLGRAGWVSVFMEDQTLNWTHYNGLGVVDGAINGYSVAGFADLRGTNGSGAYVGFAMGCNAEQFFMDGLTVANGASSVTYDYEGIPTGSRLRWWAGKKVRDGNVQIGYGSRFYMLGDSYTDGRFIVGQGTFFEKRYGSRSFVPAKTAGFDLDSYAAYKVSPKRQTTYWFGSGATNAYEASAANTITVKVFADVSGKLLDNTLRPGQRAVIKGRLKPGNRGVKVSLQRKQGGRWSTVATTRSRGGGAFDLGVTARAPGTMVLRLSIASGKGNLGTKTNSVTVTVKPRPKPDPPDPGGGGGGSTQSQETSTDSGDDVPPPDYRSLLLLGKNPFGLPPVDHPPTSSASCAVPLAVVTGPCTGS